MLDEGLCWRIGNGASIKIFQDKWVPKLRSPVLNYGDPEQNQLIVSDLIKDGTWDAQKVRDTVLPYVAEEVLSIPLPHTPQPDSRFWKYDTKGKFSVREGYRIGIGLQNPPENQIENSMLKWWRFLWSLTLPQKIRMFWWRVAHDIIPTEKNLLTHHVPVEGICPLCGFGKDTTDHALFFYQAIRGFWKGQAFKQLLKHAQGRPTIDICFWMMEQLSKSDFERFACRTWGAWQYRLRLTHSTEKTSKSLLQQWDDKYIEEFWAAQRDVHIDNLGPERNSPKVWLPPPMGQFRLDVDAAFRDQQNAFTVGGVLRNSDGNLILAFGRRIEQPLSVVHAELLALKIGIQQLRDRGFSNVQVFSDSQMAVQAVMDPSQDFGYIGSCAQEIKNMLVDHSVVSLKHMRRSANLVAHSLAQFVFSSPTPFCWVNGAFPTWLVNLVSMNTSS